MGLFFIIQSDPWALCPSFKQGAFEHAKLFPKRFVCFAIGSNIITAAFSSCLIRGQQQGVLQRFLLWFGQSLRQLALLKHREHSGEVRGSVPLVWEKS